MFADFPLWLLPIEMQEHVRNVERRKALAIKVALESTPIQKWTPDLKWAPFLQIDGDSYEYSPLFDVPPCDLMDRDPSKWVRRGDWGYRNVTLPKGESMRTCLGAKPGHVCFTTDIVIPALWQHGPEYVWMSHTPFEALSQRPGIRKARGRVLVGGLGMGWALRQLALRPNVTRLAVVERDSSLLDWFGLDLVKKICKESNRQIDVITDDAYKAADRHFKDFDSFIYDIWPMYGTARTDYKWQILSQRAKEAKKVAWAWGASGAPKRDD